VLLPSLAHRKDALYLGSYGFPFLRRGFRLGPFHVNSHMHVIGVTGSGKSRLLAQLFLELLRSGRAATLIDPAGDLARLLLDRLVADGVYEDAGAFQRIVYLDLPAALRKQRFLPLNVLRQNQPDDVIASNVKETFHRAWPELSQGAATFDTLLPDAVLLLVHNQLPLTSLQDLLIDDALRERLLVAEQDPYLVSSFRNVYDKLRKADQVQYAGSVLRRARQLTQLDVLRYGLGDQEMALDFRQIIESNTSVIVNLALPNLDAQRLLGCILTVAAEQAAIARSEVRAEQRQTTHHLIIDEFANFTAQSSKALMTMLSQTRKQGLFLVMAHQNWSQADAELRGAMQNVRVEVVMELGADDADYTARRIGPIDLLKVKHEVEDEKALERTHPLFESLPEQWHGHRESLLDLLPGQAYVSLSGIRPYPLPWRLLFRRSPRRLQKIRVQPFPDPVVDAQRLAAVEEEYLRRYFRPKPPRSREHGKETVLFAHGSTRRSEPLRTRV